MPIAILDRIGKISRLSPVGEVQWEGFGILRLEGVLSVSAVVVDEDGDEVNDSDAGTILLSGVKSLIKEIGGGRTLPAERVLKHANDHALEFLKKPKIAYVLVTS